MKSEFILFDIDCTIELTEILIAELSILEIDSFLEKDTGFEFSAHPDHPLLENIYSLLNEYKHRKAINYNQQEIGKTDWNKEWENNFHPVTVENKVLIRAPFHSRSADFDTEIIVQPKMSFGTGHHETTYMMIQAMLSIDIKNKNVLDAGCGTGILSVFAVKKGAAMVMAIDIDEWAILNTRENIALNNISGIKIVSGTVADINPENPFDLILANINRNVLISEMMLYSVLQQNDGILILSGFYETDAGIVEETAIKSGYYKTDSYTRNRWSALVFKKKSDYFS